MNIVALTGGIAFAVLVVASLAAGIYFINWALNYKVGDDYSDYE